MKPYRRGKLNWIAACSPSCSQGGQEGLFPGAGAREAAVEAGVPVHGKVSAGDEGQRHPAVQPQLQRFARRQESWFRRDPRVIWLDTEEGPGGDADLLGRALATISACDSRKDTAPKTTS